MKWQRTRGWLYVVAAGVTKLDRVCDSVWSFAVLERVEVGFGLDGGVGRYQSGAAPSLSSWELLPAAIGRQIILRASRKLNVP
jgi:hypothetical protein